MVETAGVRDITHYFIVPPPLIDVGAGSRSTQIVGKQIIHRFDGDSFCVRMSSAKLYEAGLDQLGYSPAALARIKDASVGSNSVIQQSRRRHAQFQSAGIKYVEILFDGPARALAVPVQ